MALKKGITDPLNWLLLLLAGAFVYYIFAVPYFADFYLKSPQSLTLTEYLNNPAHPRAFKLHALSAPPASKEVIITGLTVAHVDQDSILLEDRTMALESSAATPSPADETTTEQETSLLPALLQLKPEGSPPLNQILIAGDNVDLLGVSEGQVVSLVAHALHESPLGWVPLEPTVTRDEEEFFSKDELDELEFMRLLTDVEVARLPYVEVGELRFAAGNHIQGEPFTLEQLDDDTAYIQAASRLGGGTIDLTGLRIVEHTAEDRSPLFIVEDADGRRAKVFYNGRVLSEWHWALDRIGNRPLIVRGTLTLMPPGTLRQLEIDGNFQAVLNGLELLADDGAIVISLENPAGGFGGI